MTMRAVALSALALLLVVPTAHPYTDARPADGLLWREVGVALNFWAQRGVVSNCPGETKWPSAIIANLKEYSPPPPPGVAGFLDPPPAGVSWPCQIAISEHIADITRSAGYWERRHLLSQECAVVVHEVRHALPGGQEGGIDGYGHTETGIMALDTSSWTVPWACRAWARSVDRKLTRSARATSRQNRNSRRADARR